MANGYGEAGRGGGDQGPTGIGYGGNGGYSGGYSGGAGSAPSTGGNEGPSNGGKMLSKIGEWAKSIASGTPPKDQKTVSSSQNFLQKNKNMQALLDKGYTVSKSGNTVYGKYNPNLVDAREKAENRNTGISDEMAFRGAVAGINPETGMMWSGGTKGGALDQLTNTMMTPQRDRQNTSRTDKYAAQSRNALRSQKGKVGLTAEQREINRKESLFNLDLDGDGNIFSSTDDDGVVYGMSNKAIYDPSLPEAYRGIPGTYAAKSGEPQKTSEDRMLANQIASYVMPGAGIVRGVNYLKGKLAPKTDNSSLSDLSITELIEKAKSQIAPYGDFEINNSTVSEAEPTFNYNTKQVTTIKPDDLATSSNFANFIDKDPYGNPIYSNNPIVGYQADGRTPIYADDPNANQVPYMNVYP